MSPYRVVAVGDARNPATAFEPDDVVRFAGPPAESYVYTVIRVLPPSRFGRATVVVTRDDVRRVGNTVILVPVVRSIPPENLEKVETDA